MPRIRFDQLVDIYRNLTLRPDGTADVAVISDDILETIKMIDEDDDAATDSNITIDDDPAEMALGQSAHVHIGPPRISLGILANDIDTLLDSPGAHIKEPDRFFLLDSKFHKGDANPPAILHAYRAVLEIISIFSEASAYVDVTRQEIVLVSEGKFRLPVRYDRTTLESINRVELSRFTNLFDDLLHRDQKLQILSDAIVELTKSQPAENRIDFALRNIGALSDSIHEGYKLFASSFSYSKVRNELETAKIEYISKIHKTIFDIQGQLLGLPVASIVVASQLKPAKVCGAELWTDIAVLSGAWIFSALLGISIINQLLTLNSISSEISRQKARIDRDYAESASAFSTVFSSLSSRICWHRFALGIIGLITLAGSLFATIAFIRLVETDIGACILS